MQEYSLITSVLCKTMLINQQTRSSLPNNNYAVLKIMTPLSTRTDPFALGLLPLPVRCGVESSLLLLCQLLLLLLLLPLLSLLRHGIHISTSSLLVLNGAWVLRGFTKCSLLYMYMCTCICRTRVQLVECQTGTGLNPLWQLSTFSLFCSVCALLPLPASFSMSCADKYIHVRIYLVHTMHVYTWYIQCMYTPGTYNACIYLVHTMHVYTWYVGPASSSAVCCPFFFFLSRLTSV